MGIVTLVDSKSSYTLCCVNDTTGAVDCVLWKDARVISPNLGDLVLVLGKISTYRGNIRISVVELHPIQDPNEEIVWNLEILTLKKDVYRPWSFLIWTMDQWFYDMPPITRFYAVSCVAVALGIQFKYITQYQLYFHTSLVVNKLQVSLLWLFQRTDLAFGYQFCLFWKLWSRFYFLHVLHGQTLSFSWRRNF